MLAGTKANKGNGKGQDTLCSYSKIFFSKIFVAEIAKQCRIYEGESIIIRSAVAFVFLLAALSFSRASLGVVFFLSQLCRFEVARSVPLSQP